MSNIYNVSNSCLLTPCAVYSPNSSFPKSSAHGISKRLEGANYGEHRKTSAAL